LAAIGLEPLPPLRVNCTLSLFSIVFKAKLLFCAYLYFSFKIFHFTFVWKSISAKLLTSDLRIHPEFCHTVLLLYIVYFLKAKLHHHLSIGYYDILLELAKRIIKT